MPQLPQAEEPSLRESLLELWREAVPVVASSTLMVACMFTNTLCVSQVGSQSEIGGVGLGNMMQNCLVVLWGLGICSAQDTLVAAAHSAGSSELCCHYLQRCRVICTLQLLWIVPFFWFSDRILAKGGQDAMVAQVAGDYNRITLLGVFGNFMYQSNLAFLRNKRMPWLGMWIAVVTSALHIAWAVLFIIVQGMGIQGAGWANVVTWTIQFLSSSVVILCMKRRLEGSTWELLFTLKEGFQQWRSYLEVAVPSTIQICSCSWFWDICAMVVGLLGPAALAAHVTTMNFVSFLVQPLMALGVAVSSVVGNCIGARAPMRARRTAWRTVGLASFLWTSAAVILVLQREAAAQALTKDLETRETVVLLLCIYLVAGCFDMPACIMAAVLRGLAEPKVPAATYLICYYLLMLPLGIVFCWPLHLGVAGVWYAMVVGTSVTFTVMFRTLWRVNWTRCADMAQQRMEADSPKSASTASTADSENISAVAEGESESKL